MSHVREMVFGNEMPPKLNTHKVFYDTSRAKK